MQNCDCHGMMDRNETSHDVLLARHIHLTFSETRAPQKRTWRNCLNAHSRVQSGKDLFYRLMRFFQIFTNCIDRLADDWWSFRYPFSKIHLINKHFHISPSILLRIFTKFQYFNAIWHKTRYGVWTLKGSLRHSRTNTTQNQCASSHLHMLIVFLFYSSSLFCAHTSSAFAFISVPNFQVYFFINNNSVSDKKFSFHVPPTDTIWVWKPSHVSITILPIHILM